MTGLAHLSPLDAPTGLALVDYERQHTYERQGA